MNMKKLLLCGSAFILSLASVNAQTGLTATSAHDDFASATPYAALTWQVAANSATQLAMTRAAGGMTIQGSTGTSPTAYPYFSVTFAEHINCLTSGNADVYLDIENLSTTQSLLISINPGDSLGNQTQIEPNTSDVLPSTQYSDNTGAPNYWTHNKAFTAITVPPATRQQSRIDLSSFGIDSLGGRTWVGCPGTTPYTCPTTTYTINPAMMKTVSFQVNYGSGSIQISEADGSYVHDSLITTVSRFTDAFVIHDFKMGTSISGPTTLSGGSTTVGLPTAVKNPVAEGSLMVYPNPAKESLTVSFDALSKTTVSLTDIVGNTIYSTSANSGTNEILINTSGFSSGMYILNIATDNGRVTRKVSIK
jgi:hypothetical protein